MSGKTYAMLEAARQKTREGVDIVVGLVETHGRKETEALLEGLEILPRRNIEYRGAVLKEFDLDSALRRKPAIMLVDELAHTNAPGSRHKKRWQDVYELFGAGISVYYHRKCPAPREPQRRRFPDHGCQCPGDRA